MSKKNKKLKGEELLDVVYEGTWITPLFPGILFSGAAISHGARHIWNILRYHARRPGDEYGTKEAFPSLNRISEITDLSVDQINTYLDELEDKALIAIEKKIRPKGGVRKIYRLVDEELW